MANAAATGGGWDHARDEDSSSAAVQWRQVCAVIQAHAASETTMVAEFECFFGRISAPVTWSMAMRRAGLSPARSAAFARDLAALTRPSRTPDIKAIEGPVLYLVTAAATQNGVFLP